MTTIFNDTFTAASDTTLASHAPDLGTGWTILWRDGSNPSFTVVAATDTCKGVTGNDSGVIYTADATYLSADYEVAWTYVNGTNLTTRPYYVFVRLADVDNLYAVRCNAAASGFRLYKKVGGTWTALGSAFTVAVGSVCKLQIVGTTLKLFDDGVEVQSVTVSDLSAAGKGGIGSGGGTELVTATDDANSLTEIDNFSVTDVGSGGAHSLTATGVDSGSPSGGSPALTQVHSLTGPGVDTGGATVGAPALTQSHDLTGTGIAAESPSAGSPVLLQHHTLEGTGVATGVPTVGAPALSAQGNDTLEAVGVATGTPTAGVPVLTQGHILTAAPVATAAPETGSTALSQVHVLTISELVSGTPLTGIALMAQAHVLVAMALDAGAAAVGTPVLWIGAPPPPSHVMRVAEASRRMVLDEQSRSIRVARDNRRVVAAKGG